jgi:hypothetical protein
MERGRMDSEQELLQLIAGMQMDLTSWLKKLEMSLKAMAQDSN